MESVEPDRRNEVQPAGRQSSGDNAGAMPREAADSSRRVPATKRKLVVGGAVAAVLLLVFLPQLVALSPLRHELPRVRMRGFEGRMRVGHAALAWWSAPVLSDLELFAPDGEPFIHIDKFIEQRSVLTLVFRRGEAADMQVVHPVVTLKLRRDGSNVADAMAPVLEYRKQHPSKPKEREVDVQDAVLKVTDTETGRAVEWNEIAVRIHTSPPGPVGNELKLSARLAAAANAGPLEVNASWSAGGSGPAAGEIAENQVSVKTRDLPLNALAPLLGRIAPDLEMSGTTTSNMQLRFSDKSAERGRMFRISGHLALRDLDVTCPSRLHEDRILLPGVDLEGDASSDGAICQVKQFRMESDLGRFEAHGQFPLDHSNGSGDSDSAAPRSDASDFELQGKIDLVRLAKLLPATLSLREGAQLTEGEITLNLSSRSQDSRSHWCAQLESGKLAAHVGDEQVAWDEPIRLTLEVSRSEDRIEIETLRCESDVVELTGRGTSDDAHITARCNLDKLAARAGQFVDLRGRQLRGDVKLTGDLKRGAERLINASLRADIENFSASASNPSGWIEPKLAATFDAQLAEHSLRLTEVRTARFALAGDDENDSLTATLAEPVILADDNPHWNWNVRLVGELPRWQNRLRPVETTDGWNVAGSLETVMKLRVSKEDIGIDDFAADVKSLQLSRDGLDISDSQVRLTAIARWNGANRHFSVPEVNLVGSAGELHGRELLLARGNGGLPELSGRVSLKSDLDRLNPPLAKAGERPWAGRVNGKIEFKRDGDHTAGTWQLAVEDLAIRRRVEKLVEHRRGEVENIQPQTPSVQIPRPAPGVPIDRKTRRSIEKAEKETKKEEKRREKEARKRAEEVVLVPEVEWKTVWADPRMTLSGTTHYAQDDDRLELVGLEMNSDGIRLSAKGTVTEASTRAVIDLSGEVDYDLEKLVERLQHTIGRHVRVTGQEHRRFSLNGSLRGVAVESGEITPAVQLAAAQDVEPPATGGAVVPASHSAPAAQRAVVPLDLKGAAAAGWQGADLFGLKAGPAEVDLRLEKGVLAMQPLEVSLSGGKLKLAPRVLLDNQPATVVLPAGPMIENVELSQDLCDTWLRYIAPILSEATRVEGRFSVDLNESHLAVNAPANGDLSGRLRIDTAQVLPGPLFAELADYLGEIESAVTRSAPSDLLGLDKPLVRIDRQTVNFKLQEGRLYSSPLEFNVRNVRVRTRGSVGVDQTLDLVAEIFFPAEWARRLSFLARLEGKALEIPIRGTLRHPKLDGSGIGRFWEQFGQDALNNLLNGVVPRRPDR